MASSGSFNTSSYNLSDGTRYLTFSWSVSSQSIEKNTTTISWSLKGGGTSSQWVSSRNFKVKINGSTVYSSTSAKDLESGELVKSGTYTISHNADGTGSFTAYAEAGIYEWAVNSTGSKTFTLDTIPRASSFKVSSTSVNMGTAVTFTITRASTAFTHKLTLTWGTKTSTIGTDIGTSKSWTPPLSLANDLPNSTSSGCTITCYTYNGTTQIGKTTLTMTIKVPSSVVPTINSVTMSEATSGLASKFGAYIQGKSKLKVVTAASGAYSSTIKTYSVEILGKTYSGSTITSSVLGSTGSVNVEVTVTDSRGRKTAIVKSVTVLAYIKPTISEFTVRRCNSDGTINEDGEYVSIDYFFNIYSLNSKNDKAFTIGYKLKTENDYTTLTSGSVYTADATYVSSTVFNADSSYDFIISVTDYFNSTTPITYARDIGTVFTLVDYKASGTGIAFGKVSEKNQALEIALDIYDKWGQSLRNGVASYGSSSNPLDANTCLDHVFLTSVNTPTSSLWYVVQVFYSSKSETGNRAQFAIPYNTNAPIHKRYKYGGNAWTAWKTETDSQDSGWIDATSLLNSRFANYDTDAPIKYRKVGKLVSVQGALTPTQAMTGSDTQQTMITLPEDYRPDRFTSCLSNGSGNSTWYCGVSTSGNITFGRFRDATMTNKYQYATANPGEWLRVNISFFTK